MSEKNSSTIKLDKNRELRRARRTKLFFVFLLGVLVLVGISIGFLRKESLQITTITVTGARSLDPVGVKEYTQKYLDGYYGYVIPKSNTLLLNKSALVNYLTQVLPTLESVQVAFIEKNHIEIIITEKKPTALWCAEECFFVDEQGVMYETAPKFSRGIYLTFRGSTQDTSSWKTPIRQSFVPTQDFYRLQQIVATVESLGIEVVSVTLTDTMTALGIHKIGEHYVGATATVFLDPETSIAHIKNLGEVLLSQDKSFTELVATRGGFLNYVDMRYPDKIYYKFNESLLETTQ